MGGREAKMGVQTLFDLISDTELLDGLGARLEEREQKGLTSNENRGEVDLPETCGKLR